MENVQIADDVIMSIAGVSAMKVKGVKSLSGGITNNIVTTISSNSLKKGVKIEKEEELLKISLNIILEQGAFVKEVTKNVQEKVKESIENMLDLEVKQIDVNVDGIEEVEK